VDLIDRAELRGLLSHDGQPSVSLFLPTHRTAAEAHQQDRIRFKNLLARAEELLGAAGLKPPEKSELLAAGRRLLDDSDFWDNAADGLAVFLAPGFSRFWRVPLAPEESVTVDTRFHVKPLLPLLTLNSRFYLLALSQNNLKLFRCTRHTWRSIELPATPTSRAEALQFDDPERTMGRGGDDDHERQDALRRYLHEVERGVAELLRDETAPLILAGVEHVAAAYREVNRYPHLMEEFVRGNPDDKNRHARDLHAAAFELLEPKLKARRDEAAALYRQLKGQGAPRAANDIAQILAAAAAGRVDTLFISRRRQLRGQWDPAAEAVELSANGDGEDLLDLAAGHTILNNGRVYASDEALPDDAPVAAVFRY
jgi:hypothetical protein